MEKRVALPDVPDGLVARVSFDPGRNAVRVRSGKRRVALAPGERSYSPIGGGQIARVE
jgi:hypothetical protein